MFSSPLLEPAQQEHYATIIVRMCIFFSVCFCVVDAWFSWRSVVAWLYAWKASFKSMFSPPGHSTSSKRDNLRGEFIKIRMARVQSVIETALIPLSNTISPLLICMHACCGGSSNWELVSRVVFLCGRHCATLCWKYSNDLHGLSPFVAGLIFKVFMLGIAVRSYLTDTPGFLVYSGFRAAVRVLFAMLAPDCRTSIRWNLILSAVLCRSVWERREQLGIDGQDATTAFVQHVILELVLCALVCSAAAVQEFCERDILKASRESRSYRAVQRLLGVFCDAHLHICPRCNILAHSPHLVNLLGADDGARDMKSTLHGQSFFQYVVESDQQRFQDFISATAGLQSEDSAAENLDSGECALRPAASIHVSLRKEGNAHTTPVELFLICLDGARDAPELLVGIREACEALPREACTDAPDAEGFQQLAGASPAREPDLGTGEGDAGRGSRAMAAEVPPAGERHEPCCAAPALALARGQPRLCPVRSPVALPQPPIDHVGPRARGQRVIGAGANAEAGRQNEEDDRDCICKFGLGERRFVMEAIELGLIVQPTKSSRTTTTKTAATLAGVSSGGISHTVYLSTQSARFYNPIYEATVAVCYMYCSFLWDPSGSSSGGLSRHGELCRPPEWQIGNSWADFFAKVEARSRAVSDAHVEAFAVELRRVKKECEVFAWATAPLASAREEVWNPG
ncbi:unnamed protein product [Prorocentrum cordatum]|uniref:Transmembrane protein n=1 Tax=Prorocentrum cordatum TaxID=2364126 RepID=A0ABN9TL15_9DINO|nr:unnamed protein product [Polarella glacialis]